MIIGVRKACFFPKPKDIQYIITYDKEKQQVFTFERLELEKVRKAFWLEK